VLLRAVLIDGLLQGAKLPAMPNPRRAFLMVLASAAGVVATIGCNRASDAPRSDSVTATLPEVAAVDSQQPPAPSGWDATAGPVLLIASERPEAAIIVFPEVQGEHAAAELQLDTTALRGSAAALFTRAGEVRSGTLGDGTAPAEEEDCAGWPMLRISSPSGTVSPWSIGLVGTQVIPVALDSVGSLSAADSSRLVTEVARLASMVPVRESATRLRGLPFSVQDVRRFRVGTRTDIVVAHVVRRVHEEANPLEERTLLIAERDSSSQRSDIRGRYVIAFYQRSVGHEETLEGSEVLGAFTHRKPSRPTLVVARESEGGVRYTLIERSGVRTWRVKWTSALVRC
jgi:hypothetical protein